MPERTPKDVFLSSLERCVAKDAFIGAFYKRFLASSDQVREKFRFTDFAKQELMLLNSLRLCAGATVGDSDSLSELHERAKTHDRYHLNIEPSMYDLWLGSILDTAAEFDEQWNDEIEQVWREILGHVVRHMTKHY